MTDRFPRPMADQAGIVDAHEGGVVPDRTDKLLLNEEVARVSKHEVVSGIVRVSTRTETYDDVADVSLDRDIVDVTRVPVGHVVETAPEVRTEDGTVIVPVLEERFVVVKQLVLVEELHIRRRVEHEQAVVPVKLRRQVALVERLDPQGNIIPDGEGSAS